MMGNNYFVADQISQGKIKVSCTGTTSTCNEPTKARPLSFVLVVPHFQQSAGATHLCMVSLVMRSLKDNIVGEKRGSPSYIVQTFKDNKIFGFGFKLCEINLSFMSAALFS